MFPCSRKVLREWKQSLDDIVYPFDLYSLRSVTRAHGTRGPWYWIGSIVASHVPSINLCPLFIRLLFNFPFLTCPFPGRRRDATQRLRARRRPISRETPEKQGTRNERVANGAFRLSSTASIDFSQSRSFRVLCRDRNPEKRHAWTAYRPKFRFVGAISNGNRECM